MKYQVCKSLSSVFFILLIFFIMAQQSFAEVKKHKLVLLPIQAENVEPFEKSMFQNIIKQKLVCKFKMVSDQVVMAELNQLKLKSCVTEDCLEKITAAFSCDLVACGLVKFDSKGYTIGLEIKNIDSGESLFSEVVNCSTGSKSKPIKKMQLSEAISKMMLLMNKACDTTIISSGKKRSPKLPKKKPENIAEPKTDANILAKKSVKQANFKNSISLVADYTPIKFASEEMSFALVGLKYTYSIPEIGFLYCEVLTGNSSDTLYYGETTTIQVDGGSLNKLRGGYSYPFFGGSGRFDIVAGGGLEYLDLSLDIKEGGSAGITRTCAYADAGAVYIGERFITDCKFRLVLGDDNPDYTYGISVSAGMKF